MARNPTLLVLASPCITINLPWKILVEDDNQGKFWISYNSPEYLKGRHGLPNDLVKISPSWKLRLVAAERSSRNSLTSKSRR
jgi:hypothetical protein